MRRLVTLALAACAAQPKPHKPGEEWLASIRFEGNQGLKRSALLDGLALHRTLMAGRAPDPYTVQLDTDRLRGQYARSGYFDADVQARIERERDAATVVYTIEEGKRSHTRISVTGLPESEPGLADKVRAALPLKENAPFDYKTYDDAKAAMLGVVQDAGYAHAKLDAQVDADLPSHTAHVELDFTPGPKCSFGTVTVQGVTGDLEDAIRDRLHFAAGDPYSNQALTATQRDLYGMARFSTVQVLPDPGDSAVVNVKIAVSESAAHLVALGAGFGMDPISYEVRGRAGYEIVGWPMPLDRVRLDFRPAYAYLRDGSGYEPRIRAVAQLDRDDLFVTYAKGTVEVGYNYLTYEAFTEYGPEAQLGYETRLWSPHLKARVGYLIHRYDFRTPSPLIDDALKMHLGIDHPELVGGYQQSLIADFRDNPIETRFGVYGEVKVTEGTRFAGGQYEFQRVVPELRGYVPLGPVVFAGRARYGAIIGGIPPTERFYAGGSTSQRGFSERRLSPSVTGDVMGSTMTVPYGGGGMIDSSVESRIPITTVRKMPLGGVVFLDAGDVTETASQLNFGNLNYAVGAGLRLMTIVGPARFDFGWRVNRTGPTDPDPGSKYAFHLSLGEAF